MQPHSLPSFVYKLHAGNRQRQHAAISRKRGLAALEAGHRTAPREFGVYGCLSPCAGAQTLWGMATYGVARPDVAAVYGQQYLNSGYTFTKAGLAPGTWKRSG